MKLHLEKKIFMTFAVTLATTINIANASPLPPQTLKDAYVAALKRSENFLIQGEILKQKSEESKQAFDSMMPTIAGSANWTQQHYGGATSEQDTKKFTLDQPLFRGLRDFAALRQTKALFQSQAFAVKVAAKQLFFDLTQAYYNVLALAADQKNYEIDITLNQKRVAELKNFLRIGRSKETDLLTFQANQSSVEAQLEATKGQLETAKDTLAFITGWDRETIIADSESVKSGPTVEQYLLKAEDRPDIKSALASAKASSEGISIADGGHWPSLDLLGNYYLQTPGQVGGQATSQNDWDVQLALSIPLFQGGFVQSQVREAESVSYQAELNLSSTRRTAEKEIRTYLNSSAADERQYKKLQETAVLSKKNYEAEIRDFRNGLVTNIDVLTAMTSYQDSERTLDHQLYQWKSDATLLQAAAGERPEIDVPTGTDP